MILALMMLALAQADVTLGAVERLPPSAAGDLALAGQAHGPIQRMARLPAHGMRPPGFVELDMFEQAEPISGGCQRRRWTVNFQEGPSTPGDAAMRTSVNSVTEVALERSGSCPDGPYVHVNPAVDLPEAFAVLEQLDRIASGRSRPNVSCFDATSSTLCRDAQTTLRELARLRPWAVTREGRALVAWLGTPGDVVTEVRFGARARGRIVVSRKIPAPF